jgi:golgi phosphoprotein 3
MKVGFQLKQVRERLLKGLVDKGVLRTEKRNFLLFDMATHPLADVRTKEVIITRVVSLLTSSTSAIPPSALVIPTADRDRGGGGAAEEVQCRVMRTVCLVCAAYAGSVLDNAFGRLGYEDREAAFGRCDDILTEFSAWPFGSGAEYGVAPVSRPAAGVGGVAQQQRRAAASRIAGGGECLYCCARDSFADWYLVGSVDNFGRESVLGLVNATKKEARGEEDLSFELLSGVLEVLGKLDSLL